VDIPQFDFGNNGAPMHFLHANGYPPDCYQPLLDLLQPHYHLFGMTLRALWPNANMDEIKSWAPYSNDLQRFISDKECGPVIGVGHSIGGTVTLRAALRDPDKFRALVLLDPVLFVPAFIAIWKLLYSLGLGKRLNPMAMAALKRRKTFDDLETVFRRYRTREIFRYLSDENLRIYIEGITQPGSDGGYELVFSPEWESHIYMTGLQDLDLWRALPKLEVPTLIIRGAHTEAFRENAANLIKRKNPKIQIEVMEQSTHILPLEHPQNVFDLMDNFLKGVS
jgi:pimeloyl-ACP methyl ester carboxylesterase